MLLSCACATTCRCQETGVFIHRAGDIQLESHSSLHRWVWPRSQPTQLWLETWWVQLMRVKLLSPNVGRFGLVSVYDCEQTTCPCTWTAYSQLWVRAARNGEWSNGSSVDWTPTETVGCSGLNCATCVRWSRRQWSPNRVPAHFTATATRNTITRSHAASGSPVWVLALEVSLLFGTGTRNKFTIWTQTQEVSSLTARLRHTKYVCSMYIGWSLKHELSAETCVYGYRHTK